MSLITFLSFIIFSFSELTFANDKDVFDKMIKKIELNITESGFAQEVFINTKVSRFDGLDRAIKDTTDEMLKKYSLAEIWGIKHYIIDTTLAHVKSEILLSTLFSDGSPFYCHKFRKIQETHAQTSSMCKYIILDIFDDYIFDKDLKLVDISIKGFDLGRIEEKVIIIFSESMNTYLKIYFDILHEI